ncbi:FRIGIDA-like protein 3 [Linum grandiflorum]
MLQVNTQLCYKELDMKEIQLRGMKTSIEECRKDLDMKDEQLDAAKNLSEKQHEKVYLDQVHLDYVSELVRESDEELQSKKKELDSVIQELEASVKNLELKETALGSIETNIKVRNKMLRVKTNLHTYIQSQIKECSKELESMKEQTVSIKTLVEEFALALVESSGKSVDMAGEQMMQCCRKLESKVAVLFSIKTELIEFRTKLEDRRKNVEERAEAVETKRLELEKEVDMFKFREEQLVSKEKRIEEQIEVLEAKAKQLSNMLDEQRNKQQPETANKTTGVISCDSSNPDSIQYEPSPPFLTDLEVSTTLRSSTNPAKMICELLKRSNCGGDVDEKVVRSRVFFLEQLMAVSRTVSPEVKEEAKELAGTWRQKLRGREGDCCSKDDVWAFLLFLAAFGISSCFKPDDIVELVPMIADRERAPQLCHFLGLDKCIPGLIGSLFENKMHMEGIRFSVAVDMTRNFPPDMILSDHLTKTRIFEFGTNLLESQYQALNTHIDSLKALSEGVARVGQ